MLELQFGSSHLQEILVLEWKRAQLFVLFSSKLEHFLLELLILLFERLNLLTEEGKAVVSLLRHSRSVATLFADERSFFTLNCQVSFHIASRQPVLAMDACHWAKKAFDVDVLRKEVVEHGNGAMSAHNLQRAEHVDQQRICCATRRDVRKPYPTLGTLK